MGGEIASLAAEVTPYVSVAVGAYGGAVLAKVRDDAADSAVTLGRRLLQRMFGVRRLERHWPMIRCWQGKCGRCSLLVALASRSMRAGTSVSLGGILIPLAGM